MYLITGMKGGGAERMLLKTVRGIDRSRFHPVVVSLSPPGITSPHFEEAGIELHHVNLNSIVRLPAGSLRLYRLIRKIKPILIHAFMFHADICSRVFGRLSGVPIIITSLRNENIGGSRREKLLGMTDRWVDRVTAVSESVAQVQVERGSCSRDKLVVIPNGVELENFNPPSTGTFSRLRQSLGLHDHDRIILCVGRLEQQKNYPLLIRAFAELAPRYTHSKLLIVGEGHMQDDLLQLARELEIHNRVLLPGRIDEIIPIYYLAELFAITSDWEGMPNVVLEAMAAARPIVATSVGALTEMIEDGQGGLLVPAGHYQAMVEAIERIFSMPEIERAAMGLQARLRVEQSFTMQYNLDRTHRLYQELIEMYIGASSV
jgi:glycosyltransferase involved in cell wall biosynthesis